MGGFLVFLSILAAGIGLQTWYAERRLARNPAWPRPWPSVAAWTLRVLALLAFSAPLSYRALPRGLLPYVTWPGYVWLGTLFVVTTTLGLLELPRLVAARTLRRRAPDVPDASRRAFLGRTFAGAAGVFAGGTAGFAAHAALKRVGVVHVRVPIERLPAALEGFRIVQLSDLHLSRSTGSAFVAEVADTVASLGADVVAITGDVVDGPVRELGPLVAPLGRLVSRQGTFLVTGNHEYYSDAVAWCDRFASAGIRVLRNERVEIARGGAALDLAGVDDWGARSFGHGHGADLAKAVAGRDAGRVLVLLAHQPRHLDEAVAAGVDLQLSGHTHGGQIWPFGWLVHLAQPVVAGLARRGRTWIYVSRGTGFWGPPLRLGNPAEVTLVELVRV